MAALRTGWMIALLSGLVWGALAMAVIGVALALATGEPAVPPVGIASLSGAAGALVQILAPPDARDGRRWALSALSVFLVLMGATLARPFGLDLGASPVWQVGALALFIGVVSRYCAHAVGALSIGPLPRYAFELGVIRLLRGVGLTVFTVFVVLPFYVMVMTSLKSQAELLANPLDFSIDLSEGLGLFESYTRLFEEFNFGRYILNSALVSFATVFLTLLFAVPGAYAVSRLRFRGREFFARSILLIYMAPAIVLVLPLYAMFSQLELRNTLLGLLIVYPATTIPVALYMLQGYFRALPSEMEEAGLMDGLTRVGVIGKITLPLSLPALASVALYVFMIAWNEFLFAFMFLDDPGIFTLPRGVASLNSSELPRELMMAGAVIATIPVMAIFVWLERFMVQGLAAGAVKG